MDSLKNLIVLCAIFILYFFCSLAPFSDAKEEKTDTSKHPAPSSEAGTIMRVLWTVSGYHVGKNASWGKTEAERMLFKPLDINTTAITFDKQTCHDVTFESEKVDAEQYLSANYGITPQALGLEEKTLTVTKTNCNLPGFSEYMRLRDRRLIVPINGVLFIFEPAVNY